MSISKTCGRITPYLLWFSHNNAPRFGRAVSLRWQARWGKLRLPPAPKGWVEEPSLGEAILVEYDHLKDGKDRTKIDRNVKSASAVIYNKHKIALFPFFRYKNAC